MSYPDALRQFDYLERAEQFYIAFDDLPKRPPPSWPRYFMLCHAIELALKAYLAAHGTTAQQLKDFRHDFTALLKETTNKGLSLSASTQQGIKDLQEAHEKFWHRYPKEDGKPVFVIKQFKPAAHELLDSVSKALRGSTRPLSASCELSLGCPPGPGRGSWSCDASAILGRTG
jgi:hypothetical protein